MAIRVVIAEDNLLLREGVVRLVESQPDLEVVAVCGDYGALVAAVEETVPDVILTDIRMPPTGTDEGIRAARHARETRPEMGVVVLSQFDSPQYALALLEHGSEGRAYLLKERVSERNQLVDAVRAVAGGGSVIDPKVVEGLVSARSPKVRTDLDRLTRREREVLAHMAEGKNNAAVANALVLSERAVEKHINSMFSKLGLSEERDVNRRVKAVLMFLSQ